MFLAALFTIARTWKQPGCPSTDEWIKVWSTYAMEYHSAIKGNAFESVLMRWMNTEPVIQVLHSVHCYTELQSEVSQKGKDKYCILTHIYMESRKMVPNNLFAGQQWRNRHKE